MLASFFLFMQICFVIYLLYYIIAFISGAPFVPSTSTASGAMIRLAGIKLHAKVCDLGSGDGKLLFLAAQKGAYTIGYEINIILVAVTYVKKLFSKHSRNISVVWKNFWNADISNADVIFVYLLPWRMKRLEEKLLNEAKPGTKIVSNSFIFPNIPQTEEDIKNHIYLFTIPKK